MVTYRFDKFFGGEISFGENRFGGKSIWRKTWRKVFISFN
jgi:hypothetical protein